ncbi:MAG: glucose-1-phosphate thymidylyltransferase, partial [Calditrichia bacterium]|nr:glucose-1-phosphate thymidylyltransferase [Calditrichia bacterium]
MKALITSGGRGTRLRPLTHTQNKHLIPIANKPILHYAIEYAVEAGIKEIGIVHGAESDAVPKGIGDGSNWGINITYIPQNAPLGLAHVVKISQDFIGDDKFIFYLGDNILVGGVSKFVSEFENAGSNCHLALSKVPDPNRFGVAEIKNNKIVGIEEKPNTPKSNFAVTGIYLYDNNIFEAVNNIKPSDRGELEISDAHQYLLENGYHISYSEITGWWKDTGKPSDLLEANRLVLDNIEENNNAKQVKNSSILGNV